MPLPPDLCHKSLSHVPFLDTTTPIGDTTYYKIILIDEGAKADSLPKPSSPILRSQYNSIPSHHLIQKSYAQYPRPKKSSSTASSASSPATSPISSPSTPPPPTLPYHAPPPHFPAKTQKSTPPFSSTALHPSATSSSPTSS